MSRKFNFKVGDVLRAKGFNDLNNGKLVRVKRVLTINDEICINDHHIPHYMDVEPIDEFFYLSGDKWEDWNFRGWLFSDNRYWELCPDYSIGKVLKEVLDET